MKKSAPIPRGKPLRKEVEAWQADLFQIVEQAGDIVFIADREGVIEYVNPAFEAVTGYAEDEALGKTPRLLKSGMTPDDHYRQLWNTILAGEVFRAEVIDRRKNGELFYYDQTISPLKDSQGRITHFISTGKDVTERKRAEQEIRLLLQLTQTIAEAENFDSALAVSLRTVCESAGWDYGEVWFLSDDNQRLEPGAPYFCKDAGLESFRSKSAGFRFAPGIGLPGRVWTAGKAAWIPDVTLNGKFLRAAIAGESELKAAVGIPILDGDTVVAVMDFFMRETRQEDERMVALISAVAAQLGTAFQRKQAQDTIVKLHNAVEQSADIIKKRLRESDALAKIARTLSETEQFGLQTVLQLIVTSAKEFIPGAQQAVIHLLDEENSTLSVQAVAGYSHPPIKEKMKLHPTKSVAGQALASGETINLADVEKDERFFALGAPSRFRSLMVTPVQSGKQKLGSISVHSSLVSAFTEAESQLLSALGTQAAIAIENAHLVESTQQALKETNALYRIIQGLVASLDPQELLQDVVELLKNNFGYYHVQVYIMDPETGDLMMRAGSGEIGRQLKERGHCLRAGTGMVGHAAETGAAFFTNNVDDVVSFVRNPLLPDTKSELAVPVKIGNQILGVLDIQQTPPAALTQRDLQLVSAVADQLAVALQKASLYADLQAALAQEKAMRSQLIHSERLALVGRLLASVSHELNNPLQAIHNALFLLKEETGVSAQGKQDLQIVLSETERMAGLIERLHTSYRPAHVEDFQPVQINTVVENVYALVATHLRHKEIAFEFHPDPNLPLVSGSPDQLKQVTLNLLMNAEESMLSGGRLIITTELNESAEVVLTVSDTGLGIDPLLLPHIFDAFVTGKESGTGLGLAITYDIVRRHNGRIQAGNNPEGGAAFKIWLPAFHEDRT
jgi:PAS domain S-box-containing protein